MISRVQMLTVYVRDQQRALDFYVNKLGMQIKLDQTMEANLRWLEVSPPGAETSIALLKPLADAENGAGMSAGIVFETEDIQAFYDHAQSAGVMFTQSPMSQPWGGTEARFVDPDGNSFSIVQRMNLFTGA